MRHYIIAVLLTCTSLSAHAEKEIEGMITAVPNAEHVVIQDHQDQLYYIGHKSVFTPDVIGRSFFLNPIPRKYPISMKIAGNNSFKVDEGQQSVQLVEILQPAEHQKPRYGKFQDQKGNTFIATFTHKKGGISPRILGKRYYMETADDYFARDILPAVGSVPPLGYQRATLLNIDKDFEHAIFENSEGHKYVSIRKTTESLEDKSVISANELGKEFDLILYPKYLVTSLRKKTDQHVMPAQFTGAVVDVPKKGHVIIKGADGHRKSVLTMSWIETGQIGQQFHWSLVPLKRIQKIEADIGQEAGKGYSISPVTLVENLPQLYAADMSMFETPNGLIATTLPHKKTLSPALLGQDFYIEALDCYALKDINPADHITPPGYARYELRALSQDGRHATFQNQAGKIDVSLNNHQLSSTQMGKEFDLLIYPKFVSLDSTLIGG